MTAWRAIEDAIFLYSGGHARILAHLEKGWSSPGFSGSRHELTYTFAGEDAAIAGEAMFTELRKQPFRLQDHLITEVTLIFMNAVGHGENVRMDLRFEVLMLDERTPA